MKQTIYVDVLVIINIYINYGLLLLTCYLKKVPPQRLKILLASLFGGLYSLVILIPGINDFSVCVTRFPALCIMTFLAYGYKSTGLFIKSAISLLSVNLIFAGIMFALWFFICPQNMYYNSGVVYFDIDALTLMILTLFAYLAVRIISFFTKSRVPRGFIYSVTFTFSDKEVCCRAFYDSGNSLCDLFSGEGITVVSRDILKDIISEDAFRDFEKMYIQFNARLIPVKSVSGTRLMPSFRVEKMRIKGIDSDVIILNPIIAVCEEKIHGGEFGALLHSGVFENTINEKGDYNVLYT